VGSSPTFGTHGDSLRGEFFVYLGDPKCSSFEDNREVFRARKGSEEWYNCNKSGKLLL
jgi:hypothetical protein